MGLLDAVAWQLDERAEGDRNSVPLMAIVLQLLQQNGGLQGLLRQMQQSGYGGQVQSWIGTGQNQPISPDVLSQILGQGRLQELAQQLGMSQQDVAGSVAQTLARRRRPHDARGPHSAPTTTTSSRARWRCCSGNPRS